MRTLPHSQLSKIIAGSAHPLKGDAGDYDPLLDMIGNARFVLLGESSHGTHEFYRERARITQRLITEKGFSAIAVEADWPDAGLKDGYEEVFHHTGLGQFFLPLRGRSLAAALEPRRLERAIGVVYRPETERQSHYFYTHLPRQFDAVIHFDETRAVRPLEEMAAWRSGESPETFPSGI
jgi:erythromycin esterase-like protein